MSHRRKLALLVAALSIALMLVLPEVSSAVPQVQWAEDGKVVVPGPAERADVIPDGTGGAFFSWQVKEYPEGNTYMIKRILLDGSTAPGWGENGIKRPSHGDMYADGEGGVWLVRLWNGKITIIRHYLPDASIDRSVKEGQVVLNDEKMYLQYDPSFFQDEYGGTYYAWITDDDLTRCIRFDSNWQVSAGWPSEGLIVGSSYLTGYIPDGIGGVLVVEHEYSGTWTTAFNINRLTRDGMTRAGWPSNGKLAFANVGGLDGITDPGVISDENGGAFISWYKFISGSDPYASDGKRDADRYDNPVDKLNLFIGRVDSDGNALWQTPLGPTFYNGGACEMMADGFGGVYVEYSGDAADSYISMLTHLGADGATVGGWPEGGKTYSGQMLDPDGEGGAYLDWYDEEQIYKRIDGNGNTYPGWPEKGWASPYGGHPLRVLDKTYLLWGWSGSDNSMIRARLLIDVLPPPNFDTYLLVENPDVEEAEVTFTFMLENGMTKKVLKLISPHSRYTLKVNDYVPFRSVSTEITSNKPVIAERAMYFDYLSTYKGGHSCSGVPEAAKTWYLAEGYTGGSFDTYLLLQNPTDSPASTKVTYMLPGGATKEQSLELSPHSRTTVNVDTLPDLSSTELSIKVDSSSDVIAERAMYFDYYSRIGGHEQAGTTSPSKTYHLPEGYCGESFDTYILTQNPSDSPSEVTYTFMKEGGGTVERKETVSPHSRYTLKVDDVEGLSSAQFSTSVTSSEPVVVERAMYFDYKGLSGGHDAMGAVSPSPTWYLAEGYTGGSFDTYVLLENPNRKKAAVTATYMLPSGKTTEEDYTLEPLSRKTVKLDDVQGLSDTEVSTKLTTDEDTPIVAERAVYFSYGSGWDGGHDTMAVSAPSTTWCFAEGYTGY